MEMERVHFQHLNKMSKKVMTKEVLIKELNRRNTETVEQVIKELYAKINDLTIMLNGYQNSIAVLTERQSALEKQLVLQKFQYKLTGIGPTA